MCIDEKYQKEIEEFQEGIGQALLEAMGIVVLSSHPIE